MKKFSNYLFITILFNSVFLLTVNSQISPDDLGTSRVPKIYESAKVVKTLRSKCFCPLPQGSECKKTDKMVVFIKPIDIRTRDPEAKDESQYPKIVTAERSSIFKANGPNGKLSLESIRKYQAAKNDSTQNNDPHPGEVFLSNKENFNKAERGWFTANRDCKLDIGSNNTVYVGEIDVQAKKQIDFVPDLKAFPRAIVNKEYGDAIGAAGNAVVSFGGGNAGLNFIKAFISAPNYLDPAWIRSPLDPGYSLRKPYELEQ